MKKRPATGSDRGPAPADAAGLLARLAELEARVAELESRVLDRPARSAAPEKRRPEGPRCPGCRLVVPDPPGERCPWCGFLFAAL